MLKQYCINHQTTYPRVEPSARGFYYGDKTIITVRFQIVFAAILLITEAGLISLKVDAQLIKGGELAWLFGSMGWILRASIVSIGVFALLFYFKFRHQTFSLPSIKPFSFLGLAINIAFYLAFFKLSLVVFDPEKAASTGLQFLWLGSVALTLLSWCYFTFTLHSLLEFCQRNIKLILISIIAAVLVIAINFYAYQLWVPLSTITLYSSYWILSSFFDLTFMEASSYYLGVRYFVVEISAMCSGLEGLVISMFTTGAYLFFLRRELRFPVAFLLIPIAIIISILFNILRITVLVIIGAFYSPDIAIGGFHSVAGWIAAIFVAAMIVFIFSNLSFFNKADIEQDKQPKNSIEDSNPDLAWAMLLPFILFLFITLVSQIFLEKADGTFHFNYLYPIKAIVGAAALTYFWKIYDFKIPQKWGEAIIGGFVIAVLWILLVPADPAYNQKFTEGLQTMSTAVMLLWFVFRFLGAWIVVPLIEEMIFRGYLLARFSQQPLGNDDKLVFSWIAFVVSTALFAFIHFSIIAGLVAGAIFAIIRYRGKSLSEPVIAHAVANVLVSAWAVTSGQWVVM